MESLDHKVLRNALDWHEAGHRVSLVTVVQTWGSAPRPPGALLAIRDDGVVSGSVSGGCVEDDLIARTQAAFNKHEASTAQDKPSVIAYGVTQEEAARFGLPCGGSLRLVQEPLLDASWVAQLLARIEQHQLVARTLDMASGTVALHDAARSQALQFDGATLTTMFGPKWRLLLIGAGQISRAVAQMASLLDFEVLCCDPREEYANNLAAELPAVRLIAGMPDDVVRELPCDAHTAIVALTHDPKLDDMALLEALKSDAFYVGALGSRLNQQKRKQRLSEYFDLSATELARLHGPVGLALGARTPGEIALSIMAEIIQVKNGVASPLPWGATGTTERACT